MAETRNLGWLADQVRYLLEYNPNQANQDFDGPTSNTNKWVWGFVNEAYEREVEQAKMDGGMERFVRLHEVTWEANDVTYTIPVSIQNHSLYEMTDVTSGSIGERLNFNRGELFWKDSVTLQWGTTGPARDTTVRISYLANAQEMTSEAEEPDIIPHQFRRLIVWRAAVIGRSIADDKVPDSWRRQAEILSEQWTSFLCTGSPVVNNPARIPNMDGY